MWPLVGIALLVFGAAAAKRRSGPLDEGPDPGATEEETVTTAEEAAQQAAEAAAEGDSEKANDALNKAAEAASAAAGTNVSDLVTNLAKQVEALAQQAAQKSGTKAPPSSPGQPPVPKESDDVVVETDDGVKTTTPSASFPAIPKTVEEAVKKAEEIAASLPIPTPIKKTPSEQTPLEKEETKPASDPNGTIRLARLLLDRETEPDWRNANTAQVTAWQKKVGLKADGKFGPGSAAKMADEVGVLPLVRFWPQGSVKATVLKKYRRDMTTKAANLESRGLGDHANALVVSAEREDARSYGNPNAKPVTSDERMAALSALVGKVA